MTQRERQTPDGGAQALPPPVADQPAGTGTGWWEEFFPGLPAPRQQELLDLAGRQGLLYAHQVGSTAAPPSRRPTPASLLNGAAADLETFNAPPLAEPDTGLDAAQRDAVARAMHTPDICLIQGAAGTGKSRVVAEIVVRAAARGERVLLLAASPAALDCVLERVGANEALCPVRCVGVDERPEALPACVRRVIFAERLRFFEEKTVGAARQALDAARQQCAALRHCTAIWPRLESALHQLERIDADGKSLAECRVGLPAEVAAATEQMAGSDATPFGAALRDLAARRAATVADFDSRQAASRADAEELRGAANRLEMEHRPLLSLAAAKRSGRWWTIAWWRATFRGGVLGRVEQLERQLAELRPTETRLAKQADDLAAERSRADSQFRVERQELARAEIARRLSDLEGRAANLTTERTRAEADWQVACGELTGVPAPAEATRTALCELQAEWARQLKTDEERCDTAALAVAGLEEARPTFPERLASCVNLVAATPRALALDGRFGDSAAPPVSFDLLILEEADQFTEADFLQAARRARRWVLVGEPQPDADAPTSPSQPGRTIRPQALRPGFFQRMWRNLRWNPCRLPYRWEQRGERLHCRLRSVKPDQDPWVQTERLADRPDVELHILARPREEPELVEVVFPATTTVPEAKEYLFRELGEVTLQAADPDWYWTETSERVVLRLSPDVNPNAVMVPLGAGVRELVAPLAGEENDESAEWRTGAVEFDRCNGWDAARAAGWAAEQLHLRDTGRSALLATPHRSRPVLAAWLSHVLAGANLPAFAPATETTLEFVAVPSLGSGDRTLAPRPYGRSRDTGGSAAAVATRLRPVKGGAGLETDLADSRRIDQMPADLRACLPPHGVVNFLEAKALVRCLEEFLADEAFLAAAERWRRSRAQPCELDGTVCAAGRHAAGLPAHCPTVAVIALYAAQADLIARLLQRVPAVLAAPVTVEVGTPANFRHRECLVALVSLTRSHTHRAVPYGDGPQALALALTRAAERVVVFGDPGTLGRRSHWQGALDHLDHAAAERERALAARITRLIQGTDAVPPGFRLREGNLV